METAVKWRETEALPYPPDPYGVWVNEFTRYLSTLPGGPRRAWQEAAYQSYLADKLEP